MDQVDVRLAEEVRKYTHLYDPSSPNYKDSQMATNSWKEISTNMELDVVTCIKKWKNMRDKYVRVKKKLARKSGDPGGQKVPAFFYFLSWLGPHVKHRDTDSNFDDNTPASGSTSSSSSGETPTDTLCDLPLSSLRLFVSPICLMSASMWKVAQQRNVKQYGKLEEFVTLVTQSVPELLTFRQRAQLILGLRARLILELCQSEISLDPQTIQHHLDRIHLCTKTYGKKENERGDVEASMSNFVELVQTLLKDPSEREHFFKEVFPEQYGPRYDTALQILVWEFFSRLEALLPVQSFSQAASCLSLIVSDLENCEESFSDPEPLTTLLQHQRSKGQLHKSQFSYNSDTILSALSLRQDEYIERKRKKDIGGREAESERENVNKEIEEWEQVDDGAVIEGMDGDTASWLDDEDCHRSLNEAGESHIKQQLQDSSPQASSLSPSVANNGQSGDAASHILTRQSSQMKKKICLLTPTSCGAPKSYSTKKTKMLPCTLCQKSFSCLSALKRHHSVHTEVRRFPCKQCDKNFKSKANLEKHMQTHTVEKPYVCSDCGRAFKYSGVLKSHVRTHTGERPYACSLCDKKFTQRTLLTIHLRTHTGDKPYLCSACGKTFCSSGALLIHSRGHTGERPYHCDYCGKAYITLQRKKLHQRCHTGERPYLCNHCEKRFSSSTGLKRHMLTHTGEKPHQCFKCGKRFSLKGNVKIHLRSHKS